MTEASTALLAEYSKTAIIRAEVKGFRGRFGEGSQHKSYRGRFYLQILFCLIPIFVYEFERKRRIKLAGSETEQKRTEQVQTEPFLSTAVATGSNSRQNSTRQSQPEPAAGDAAGGGKLSQRKSITKLSLPTSQSIYTLKFAGFWPASGARRDAEVVEAGHGSGFPSLRSWA